MKSSIQSSRRYTLHLLGDHSDTLQFMNEDFIHIHPLLPLARYSCRQLGERRQGSWVNGGKLEWKKLSKIWNSSKRIQTNWEYSGLSTVLLRQRPICMFVRRLVIVGSQYGCRRHQRSFTQIGSNNCKATCYCRNTVWLSTSPTQPLTHW